MSQATGELPVYSLEVETTILKSLCAFGGVSRYLCASSRVVGIDRIPLEAGKGVKFFVLKS